MEAANTVAGAAAETRDDARLKSLYMEALTLLERLHRRLLDVIKDEFDRQGRSDVNAVQALLLFNIGDAELTVGELTQRGYYQGSNVSYNVKKMVENGYLVQERSQHDRRSFHVRAAPKGLEISKYLDELFQKQSAHLDNAQLEEHALELCNETLTRLGQFWSMPQRYGQHITSAA